MSFFVPSRKLVNDIVLHLRRTTHVITPSIDDDERMLLLQKYLGFCFAHIVAARAEKCKKFYVVWDMRLHQDLKCDITSMFNLPLSGPDEDLIHRLAREFHEHVKNSETASGMGQDGNLLWFILDGRNVVCERF